MFEDHSDVMRDIALEAGLVDQTQSDELWESHATTGKSFTDSLIDAGLADRPTLLQAVADHLQVQYYSVIPADLADELTRTLKPAQAHKYMVVPVADEAGKLTLVAKDAFNSSAINELTFILKRDIELAVADPDMVESAVIRIYGEASATSMEDLLGEFEEGSAAATTDEDVVAAASLAPISASLTSFCRKPLRPRRPTSTSSPLKTSSVFVTASTVRCTKWPLRPRT